VTLVKFGKSRKKARKGRGFQARTALRSPSRRFGARAPGPE
jgi:hypothetical protein